MDPLFGKRVSVVTLGCRSNHYEAEAIISTLEARGAVFAGEDDPLLDAIILLTCSITAVADAKTRKLLRRFRRSHPQAALVASGCFAQHVEAPAARKLGVDILVGNRKKHLVADALSSWFGGEKEYIQLRGDVSRNEDWDQLFLSRPRRHVRAFVKVQDGCAHGCSYCLVPLVRGASVSRAPADFTREIRAILASNTKEIVLTGVDIGDYHHSGANLADLVRIASSSPGLTRLRLGSIEPFSISEALLDQLSASSAAGVFCPHLHLPLQSGDDFILRRMRRGYDISSFAETVGRIRSALGDDLHLSTDLIVGFPGELDSAFAASLSALRELRFAKIHVFPFSPRAGTEAASFTDAVPSPVVKERMAQALQLADELLDEYAKGWASKEASVLIEREENGLQSGWSRYYVKTVLKARAGKGVGDEVAIVPERAERGVLFERGALFASLHEDVLDV